MEQEEQPQGPTYRANTRYIQSHEKHNQFPLYCKLILEAGIRKVMLGVGNVLCIDGMCGGMR